MRVKSYHQKKKKKVQNCLNNLIILLLPGAPKQKKKQKCPPESEKNQKDIQSYIAATPRQATKKPETKKPKSPNVIIIEFWTLVFYLCFFNFFSKESIIINIERHLCFVLQTKNTVKKINSVKANFDFFIRKKVFSPWI